MPSTDTITFTDNKAAQADPARFVSVTILVDPAIKSWRDSVFSFEWLDSEGAIKPASALSEHEQQKRKEVEDMIAAGAPLDKPILGIGLEDNVEIGSGRATFLTLAALGLREIPVHIPKSCQDDFSKFLA